LQARKGPVARLQWPASGRHAVDTQFGELAWELRSVNHRYLDISIRLPEDLKRFEPDVRERAAARLHRGKVEISTLPHWKNSRRPLRLYMPQFPSLPQRTPSKYCNGRVW